MAIAKTNVTLATLGAGFDAGSQVKDSPKRSEFYLALLNSSMNGLSTPAMRGLELVDHTISRSNFTSPFDVI